MDRYGAPHPGAQLRFTDIDGHRFTCFATDAKGGQLADLKLRHRPDHPCGPEGETTRARGTPPTRRDSRAARHGPHTENSNRPAPQAIKPGSRKIEASGNFYFMEVNCRIQVEHPVTEMVTGVDLVWEQLRVACGMPLDLTPDDMTPRGVSLECRINAEDPARGFMPAPGRLDECVLPAGPFVRVDSHAYHGYQVPAVYDSLLAKVVVWAPDRPRAISRMLRALDEFRLRGPGFRTTASFIWSVLQDPRFVRAKYDTSLVSRLMAG